MQNTAYLTKDFNFLILAWSNQYAEVLVQDCTVVRASGSYKMAQENMDHWCILSIRQNGTVELRMDKDKSGVFKLVKGLKPVDTSALADYEREMTDEAIPEIIRDVDKRRMLAAESRHRMLSKAETR